MEINPRPWLWNSLTTESGCNLVGAFIHSAMGVESTQPCSAETQTNNLLWMSVWNDLEHNVVRHRTISIIQWIKCVFNSRRKAYWELTDPLPSVAGTLVVIRGLFVKLAKKLLGRK